MTNKRSRLLLYHAHPDLSKHSLPGHQNTAGSVRRHKAQRQSKNCVLTTICSQISPMAIPCINNTRVLSIFGDILGLQDYFLHIADTAPKTLSNTPIVGL